MGGLLGVKPGVDAAVVADADALFRQTGLLDDGGKGVGSLPHDVFVHTVASHAHHAPQAGRAEGQRPVKPVGDLLVVQRRQFGPLFRGEGGSVQPALILGLRHRQRSFHSLESVSFIIAPFALSFHPDFAEKGGFL